MSPRTLIGLTAVLMAAATSDARAEAPVPASFRSLKPYQVVEQVMAQKDVLNLTDEQFARLDGLSIAIRTEPHRFTHKGGKPHVTRHVPMVSKQRAYDQAVAVLTPEQQLRVEALFPAPAPAQPAPRKHTAPRGKP